MALLSTRKPRTNWAAWLGRQLDEGWFSRIFLVAIYYTAWRALDWSTSYAGTVLAMDGPKDLVGCAAVITAVGGVPVVILTMGLNSYATLRAAQPRVIEDRRKPE